VAKFTSRNVTARKEKKYAVGNAKHLTHTAYSRHVDCPVTGLTRTTGCPFNAQTATILVRSVQYAQKLNFYIIYLYKKFLLALRARSERTARGYVTKSWGTV